MGLGAQGQRWQGTSYLGRWDLLISSPMVGEVEAEVGLGPKQLRGQSAPWGPAESWKLTRRGTTRRMRRERAGGAERAEEPGRERVSKQLGEGAGERGAGERGRAGRRLEFLPPRLVFFNANSVLFAFHLNSRCCYKLSTSSLFLQSL